MLENNENEKSKWLKREKRIRRVIIAVIIAVILFILAIIFFRDKIWIVLTNAAIIVGLIVDLLSLKNYKKGDENKK